MKKQIISLCTLMLVVLGLYTTMPNPQITDPNIFYKQVSLDTARQAVIDILFSNDTGGTAILVGRKINKDGGYTYQAITAEHVIKNASYDDDKNCSILITFQFGFHDKPIQAKVNIIPNYSIPSCDFGAFTFTYNSILPCVHVATRNEFKELQAFEQVYVVGCFAEYSQQCRIGTITTTHNISIFPEEQRTHTSPWDINPEDFLRLSVSILPGDSGGGVFDSYGRLIAILNARTVLEYTACGDMMWEPSSGVGLKTHVLYEMVGSDFFLIED